MHSALKRTSMRLLALLLSLLLVLSCSGCLSMALYYFLEDERVETPVQEIVIETEGAYNDLDFDELCAVLFEHEIVWDSLSLNQLVANPEALDIEVPRPATLGDYSYEGTQEDNQFYAEILESLTGGHTIFYDELSEEDQLTYQIIEDSLRQTLEYEQYFYYYEPLSPSTGVHSQLPLNFLDYSFRTVEDIQIYLELLEDVPRLFDQLIQIENDKLAQDLLMSREAIDDTLDELLAYTGEAESHVLVTAFNEILDTAVATEEGLSGLTAEDVEEFKLLNFEAVEMWLIPAYEELYNQLDELSTNCKEGTRLYDYPLGTQYYELEMESMGFNESASSAISTLDTALEDYWNIIRENSLSYGFDDLIPESVVQAIGEDPSSYISYIKEQSAAEFAPAEDLTYEIKIASEETPNDYAMAYFMLPPVDDPLKNVIVYFPENINDDVELYSTIAHEAYPGHMYQTYAYSLNDPKNIDKVLGSLAYMEGWAMYAQGEAMRYLDAEASGIEAYIAYEKFIYALHARVDLGVNFEGWSVGDTERYLANWGFDSAAQDLYEVSIKQPVSYLPYGLGVVEFDELRNRAESMLGDNFNALEYHQMITGVGPLPFDMLESQLEEWINFGDSHQS